MNLSMYVVWGEAPTNKFQLNFFKKSTVFRLVVYKFAFCIIRTDIERRLEMLSENIEYLTDNISELVFAYENKSDTIPHDFEMKAIETANTILSILEHKEKQFCKSVLEEMKRKKDGTT